MMRFYEILNVLLDREDQERFNDYILNVFIPLMYKDYDPDDILSMPIESVMIALKAPSRPMGWNTYWGKHLVG